MLTLQVEGFSWILMHYYQDEMTRQHFTCCGHYYGRVWNWFVEKLVDLNHACWCLSVLWAAIPESKVRTASCSSNKMNQPRSPKRKKKNAKKRKKLFFGATPCTKMGSANKMQK